MTTDELLQIAQKLDCTHDHNSIAYARLIAEHCAEIADATFADGTTPGNAIREAFGAMTR